MHLGNLDQIRLGEGRSFSIGFHEVAVFRSIDGRLFAVESRCPQGGCLAAGVLKENIIECPTHGHKFNLYTGLGLVSQECVRTFKVWEENGNIMLLFAFPAISNSLT